MERCISLYYCNKVTLRRYLQGSTYLESLFNAIRGFLCHSLKCIQLSKNEKNPHIERVHRVHTSAWQRCNDTTPCI